MFDGIAHRYDFLNHFLSGGIDILWRRRAIRTLEARHPAKVLDVATGTADFAIEAAKTLRASVIGVDISDEMLALGREKIRRLGLSDAVSLKRGKAESLDFPDETFDAVTVAFGVRNFADVQRGLREMCRVLRPGGVAVILEFSQPRTPIVRSLYGFYFERILPWIGGIVSSNRASYEYLPSSVLQFPDGTEFLRILQGAGFALTKWHPLTMGIASIYLGYK